MGRETRGITEVLVHHGATSDATAKSNMAAIGSGENVTFLFVMKCKYVNLDFRRSVVLCSDIIMIIVVIFLKVIIKVMFLL